MNTQKIDDLLKLIPMIDCGACGFRSCDEFIAAAGRDENLISKCIHLEEKMSVSVGCCSPRNNSLRGIGEKMGWKDSLQREFDFILDPFDNEPGPRETILPYNPLRVKELGIKKGDILIGRPMGMSCGCPVTHCGTVMTADEQNGVMDWCVTGPLQPRHGGYIDIGYYVAQAYEGKIIDYKEEIVLGKRYWFIPRRCMLQWRHSGLVNMVTKNPDGTYKVRIEGLYIG